MLIVLRREHNTAFLEYQRWPVIVQSLQDILQREEQRCRELVEVEPERSRLKWPLLTLCLLLKLQQSLTDTDATEELQKLYAELAEIDPLRRGFYRDAPNLKML